MMKNRYNILFIVLLSVAGLVSSCYDDSSTLDVNEIPGIVVDKNGVDELNVYQYERLQVNPDISAVGIDEQNIEYEWKINFEPNDTLFTVIGTEKNLDYEVFLKPNQGGKTYQLLFTAKDKLHELEYLTAWELEVKNPIGEGLIIAELHNENKTDFSLIMSPEVTEGYDRVTILKNVYSVNSGQQIDGLVKQIHFTNMYGSNIMLAITDNSITQINTFDYSFGAMNDELFFAAKDSYSPQLLGGVNQSDIYVGNNRLTTTWLGVSRKFGLPYDYSYEVPGHLAMQAVINHGVVINFYDESLGGFVYLPSIYSFLDNNLHSYAAVSGADFDPSNVPDKINLAASTNLDGDFLHLLKDKNTNAVELYVFNDGASGVPPSPKALFDLSAAPDIENAKHFVFLDNQKVMFYATDTKIYAMIYSTSTPIFQERYTVASGEEITTLQVYQQYGYPRAYGEEYIATNNKQLVMSTYGSEGKVYLLPFINLGAANIDEANIKTFTGFERITAITPQQ